MDVSAYTSLYTWLYTILYTCLYTRIYTVLYTCLYTCIYKSLYINIALCLLTYFSPLRLPGNISCIGKDSRRRWVYFMFEERCSILCNLYGFIYVYGCIAFYVAMQIFKLFEAMGSGGRKINLSLSVL